MSEFLTTYEVAEKLGYTPQHTRFLIRKGRITGQKHGRDWLVAKQAVEEYQSTFVKESVPPSNCTKTHTARKGVNVATVPQRSPFRYPGGKTWLIPVIRRWLRSTAPGVKHLVEPFAGGGIVSLTAIFEDHLDIATMCERDERVAAVWRTILNGDGKWLAQRIRQFGFSESSIHRAFIRASKTERELAFAVILRNRISRGGIMAPGAGVVKRGENGKGLASRWYPETLAKRILAIVDRADRLRFLQGDGFSLIKHHLNDESAAFFLDPPYTVAGRRLYRYSHVDHERLFELMSRCAGDFLMTYDDAREIRDMAERYRFQVGEIVMKNTHNSEKVELLVARHLEWLG